MPGIIKRSRSIVPACDFGDTKLLAKVVKETCDIEGIGAYKIGFELALKHGLPKAVATARKYTEKPVIYDHQKAGTDVPFTGERFAAVCKSAGVDAVILFPQAGPATETEWIKACRKSGLGVIVGGEMTHESYLKAEGGFIEDDAPRRMYEVASENGVTEFVVPGNKPEKILLYRSLLESKGIKPVFYSPGLVSQGGSISDSGRAAGERWHAIVGRALYGAKDIRRAARELCSQLLAEGRPVVRVKP